jgi:hypothetical protein
LASGDKNDPFPFTVAETNAVLRLPNVERMMRRKFVIDSTGYDIPYLAGYSQDGGTIYIDRDLEKWHFLGADIDTKRFLLLHEHVEKSLIDAIQEDADRKEVQRLLILLKMTAPDDKIYYHSHGVATACELYAVKLQHGAAGVKSYNSFMGTQIKRAEDERIRRVPRNLDMTPYGGKDKQDVHLRAVMHAAMEK